jgi:prevent-host-death family protein
MRTVGLKVLKNKLSEYVRAAASGETVVITDRGQPIAELVAPRQVPDRYKDHPVLARGIREGWITPAVRGPDWPPPRNPIKGYTLENLLADLDEDRADRWC